MWALATAANAKSTTAAAATGAKSFLTMFISLVRLNSTNESRARS